MEREKREIKFRAWYPDEKRMEYQDDKTPTWIGDILTNSYYKVMQFTGLKHKNGKDIYEGDRVKMFDNLIIGYTPQTMWDDPQEITEDSESVVIFNGCSFCVIEPNSETIAPIDQIIETENIEIIGNIYN